MKRRRTPPQKRHRSKQDYATPANFIEAAKRRLGIGAFDFDFAANGKNTKAARYWSARDDSLSKPAEFWRAQLGTPGGAAWDPDTQPIAPGAVMTVASGWGWLNPPFNTIEPWAHYCALVKDLGGSIAFLVPASVGADWFRDHVADQARVLFLNGRLAFIPGKPKEGYPKDCILCLFSPTIEPGYEVWSWR